MKSLFYFRFQTMRRYHFVKFLHLFHMKRCDFFQNILWCISIQNSLILLDFKLQGRVSKHIPFPIDRDGHDFHALFQYMFYTWVQNCTLIELFFNKILNKNMASDAKACFSSKVEYRAVIQYLYLKDKTMFMGLLHQIMLRLNSG